MHDSAVEKKGISMEREVEKVNEWRALSRKVSK